MTQKMEEDIKQMGKEKLEDIVQREVNQGGTENRVVLRVE